MKFNYLHHLAHNLIYHTCKREASYIYTTPPFSSLTPHLGKLISPQLFPFPISYSFTTPSCVGMNGGQRRSRREFKPSKPRNPYPGLTLYLQWKSEPLSSLCLSPSILAWMSALLSPESPIIQVINPFIPSWCVCVCIILKHKIQTTLVGVLRRWWSCHPQGNQKATGRLKLHCLVDDHLHLGVFLFLLLACSLSLMTIIHVSPLPLTLLP